jgi:hypothetical protein
MSSSVKNNQRLFGTAIIGAGIHGLHLLTRLVDEKVLAPEEIVLIDPHGEPAGQWRRRTAGCGMRYLRSPGSHGITRDFRTIRRSAGTGQDEFIPPYHRPSTDLFVRHIDEAWRRSAHGTSVVTAQATRVAFQPGRRRDEAGEGTGGYVVESESPAGRLHHRALTVVLAPGQPEPQVPAVLASLPPGSPVFHVYDSGFRPDRIEEGTRIAVVGGGIAAAHLLIEGVSRGGIVDFWNRDRPTAWQFDSDPCFVGPRCGSLFSNIPSPGDRRVLIGRARRRGSLPPDLYDTVAGLITHERIRLVPAAVSTATVAGRGLALTGRIAGRPVAGEYDLVVACTGFGPEPPAKAIVDCLARESHLPRYQGYPIPRDDLSWGPGLYVTGALGELVTGPPARNIIGAHLAARRIVPAIARYLSVRG